jgi:uncharacterized protein YkwD
MGYQRLAIIGLVVLVAATVGPGILTHSDSFADAVARTPPDVDETRAAFDERLAELRADRGLGPVRPDARLEGVATDHAGELPDRFGHHGSSARLDAAGCAGGGEVIAYSYLYEDVDHDYGEIHVDGPNDLARELFLQWFHSAEHRAILLDGDATRYGLGIHYTEDSRVFATLDIC